MKAFVCSIIFLVFWQVAPTPYKEIKIEDGRYKLSIPVGLKELRRISFCTEEDDSKTYIAPDTTLFLFVRVDRTDRKHMTVESEKGILKIENVTTTFVADRTYLKDGFMCFSIDYKTEGSGSNVNREFVYRDAKYWVTIQIWVKKTYRGQFGKSGEMIERIGSSFKRL